MKVKCIMCSKETELTKLHKDYRKVAADPEFVYVCEFCAMLISSQAADHTILEQ